MPSPDYHFITHWRVPGTVAEVADVLKDTEALPRWWPSVYLDVQVLEAGDANGVGKLVSLYTKGWLPYTLRWRFRVTESRHPYGYTIEALGDLDGRGIWTLRQDGDSAAVTYDWRVRARKPLLRALSFLLKPIFKANHEWAMRRGEESLILELARRRQRARPPEAAAPTPAPPGPTWPHHRRRRPQR